MNICTVCFSTDGVARYCPSCGAEQPADGAVPPDPLIGKTIVDRYEIVELINSGGMGRVYRGVQRSLERSVAIKFIHPHLSTSETLVKRFMVEAQAASRLNHPNVVSIFDFGRTPPVEGSRLYLVMELLSGPDLASLLTGPALPIRRVADILRQTLAALGEAHHGGITHRDVKPENIILEPLRGGGEVVKVFDFGIAKIGEDSKLTQTRSVLGTPWYMAPELVDGRLAGPSADLYAVGVMLFEMLTGRLPFDGDSAADVLSQQLTAVRPDPRQVAPERGIPGELAELCMRAIDIDPSRRFPDAVTLAESLAHACAAPASSAREASIFRGSHAPSTTPAPAPGEVEVPEPAHEAAPSLEETGLQRRDSLGGFDEETERASTAHADAQEPPSTTEPRAQRTAEGTFPLPPLGAMPLVGRADELAWALRALDDDSIRALALWGGPGTGRTRLLRELGAAAEKRGATVLHAAIDGPPLYEVGYAGLWVIVAALTAVSDTESLLSTEKGPSDPQITAALCVLLGTRADPGVTRDTVRTMAATVLAWAVDCALERHPASEVVMLCIDDVDQMDGVSLLALTDLLWQGGPARLKVVLSSQQPPDTMLADRIAHREIRGLSSADASQLLDEDASLTARLPGTVAPLLIEQLRYWRDEGRGGAAPNRLTALIEARIARLTPMEREVLQALALTGGCVFPMLASVVRRSDGLDEALGWLSGTGLIEMRRGSLRVSHTLVGETVLSMAPAGALAELHARAADAHAEVAGAFELRAFHAIRGNPGFEAYLLVEECARLRTLRGDDDGAIACLRDGLTVTRTQHRRGNDESAATAAAVFARKLASALLATGQLEEADAVLQEALSLGPADGAERGSVLEQLALVQEERARRVPLGGPTSSQHDDDALAQQRKRTPPRAESGMQRKAAYPTPNRGMARVRPEPIVRHRASAGGRRL